MRILASLCAVVTLAGCATIVDGTQQTISLTSNVEGAMCGITQRGVQVVAPAPVPVTRILPRTSGNLIVTCEAEGYETAKVALIAGKSPKSVVLNAPAIVTGALADTALGGIDWYQDRAYVYLKRKRLAAAD